MICFARVSCDGGPANERAASVRLLVLDVDGVLTDGRLYFSARGEEMKSFHVRDGSALVRLLAAGVQVAVISGRQSRANATAASKLRAVAESAAARCCAR